MAEVGTNFARPPPVVRSATQDGMTCVVCQDVLIQPVTLTSGQNLCLHCCTEYMWQKRRTPFGPPPTQTVCPLTSIAVPLEVPSVNVVLRNTIEQYHSARVAERLARDSIPTIQNLQPKIDQINAQGANAQSASGQAAVFARGRGGLFFFMAVIAMLAAFLGGYAFRSPTDSAPAVASATTDDLLGSATGLGLDWYSKNVNGMPLSKLEGLALASAASLVGVRSSADQKLLFTGMAAHGVLPLSDWSGDDVATWLTTVLPAEVAREFEPTAKAQLDGSALLLVLKGKMCGTWPKKSMCPRENDLVELGLPSLHARRAIVELEALG